MPTVELILVGAGRMGKLRAPGLLASPRIRLRAVVDAYRPDCLAWESVDMLRKVAMVGFVVFLGQGTFEQMVGAAGLSCAYLALHVKIWPFKVGRDNLFRMLTEIQCECLPLSFRVLC